MQTQNLKHLEHSVRSSEAFQIAKMGLATGTKGRSARNPCVLFFFSLWGLCTDFWGIDIQPLRFDWESLTGRRTLRRALARKALARKALAGSHGTGSHGTGSHGSSTGSNSLTPGSLAELVRLCNPFCIFCIPEDERHRQSQTHLGLAHWFFQSQS